VPKLLKNKTMKNYKQLVFKKEFIIRQLKHLVASILFIFAWIALGTIGYHFLGELEWIDAFVDASMIGSGMGPVNPLHTNTGKIFASFYAIFSGIVFITNIGILFTPIAHKIFKKMDF
jgi:hypothetical protein